MEEKPKESELQKPQKAPLRLEMNLFNFIPNLVIVSRLAVGEERALAIPTILQEHPEINVILLDDAFQHRRVSPSLSILLSDYNGPFYRDYVLTRRTIT